MSRIVLAQLAETIWLVGGIDQVDALLLNQLPPETPIEFVVCSSQAELAAVTAEHAVPGGDFPWMINPKIVSRLRAKHAGEERAVAFSPWSAMIDQAGLDVVAAAAGWAAANGEGRLVLRQFAAEAPAPGMEDLQRLRRQLVAGALERAGVAAERLREEMREGADADQADRLVIAIEQGKPPSIA